MAVTGDMAQASVAVFLDRDGVINEERSDYVKSWGEFHFLPGALEAMSELTGAGCRLFVITNQSAIHRGLVSWGQVQDIHRRMREEIERAGGAVEAVLVCPHRPDEGCECRKPRPGLLERAAREYALDLNRCYLIGDKLSDIAAGQAVGCRCALVQTGLADPHQAGDGANVSGAYRLCRDAREAAEWILEREGEAFLANRPSDSGTIG